MARRNLGTLRISALALTAALTMAVLAPAVAHGAVGAKTSVDPCKLLTSEALAALAKPFEISSASPLTNKRCEYQLRGTGSNDTVSGPAILSVDSLSLYKINKAIVHKAKAVKGLGVSGYRAVDGAGEPVVGFQTKTQGFDLAGGFDAATLIALAKTFSKQVK
jgi:hypothetical protein